MQPPAAADGDRSATTSLSLKARETASLSLKRIFDQHLQISSSSASAAAAAPFSIHHPLHNNNGCRDDHAPQLHILDLELRLAAPCLSVSNHTELIQDPPAQSSNPLARNANTEIASTSKVGPLTVFYAGTVWVFEDVPADKAKAIMLLAAGSARDQFYTSRAFGNAACKSRPTTPDIVLSRPLKPRARSQAELPFARKASLARFLEKRKDRVEGKAANAAEMESTKDGEIPTEPSHKRLCTRTSTNL